VKKTEIIKMAFRGEPEVGFYLSDDFRWTDELGSPPVDKASFVSMAQPLQTALPDYALIVDAIQEEGDSFVVTSHTSGTFVNDLDLSAMGMGVVPATGKPIDSPPQRDRLTFDGDRISEIHNLETGPDAGMAGLLKALGVKMS
jgi:hypothetical protein